MSLLNLPEIKAATRIGAAQFDLRPDALDRWQPGICAAADGDASISIYDQIGESWDGSGMTASRMSGILRNIGARDVVVNVNSPGGDFFEGVAIYNLLRQHKARVTVQIMGMAASAASVIAMAGDEILMGDGAFLMVHNAWAVAVGNRHDMLAASEQLAPFDAAMADVYAARTGLSVKAAVAMMDAETWIGSAQAVKDGFATGMIDRADITQDAKAQASKKYLALVEASMARAGHSRTVRRDALQSLFSSTPGAAGDAKPGTDIAVAASLQSLLKNIQGIK